MAQPELGRNRPLYAQELGGRDRGRRRRLPDYWRGPAFFDRVIYRNIPDTATQKLTLEAGGIDLAVELSSDQIAALKMNPEIKVVEGQGTDMFFLLCNANPELTDSVMSDNRVRNAIRYALDYEGLRALAGGSAINPPTIVPFGFLGAWGTDKAYKRDLEQAKALLTEAGYPDGFDIDMEYPTKFTRAGIDFDIFAEKVQADLAEVGINVTLKPGELMTVLADFAPAQKGSPSGCGAPTTMTSLTISSFCPRASSASAPNGPMIGRIRRSRTSATPPRSRWTIACASSCGTRSRPTCRQAAPLSRLSSRAPSWPTGSG